jgi:hypothetical protein
VGSSSRKNIAAIVVAAVHDTGKAGVRIDHAFGRHVMAATGEARAEILGKRGGDESFEVEIGDREGHHRRRLSRIGRGCRDGAPSLVAMIEAGVCLRGDECRGARSMSDDETRLRGSCLCGRVSYEVPDAFEYALICHCSECRRTTGAAAKPLAGIAAESLTLHGEEEVMRHGEAWGHNVHCKHCGSLLYALVRDGTYVHVTMGTLIDSPSIRPSAHIFVGSKALWETICDDLPQFDELPPD